MAGDGFDPYYVWFGIPRESRPLDYYRLLGLARYETSAELIVDAAARRAELVRAALANEAPGYSPYEEIAQRVLQEVAQAQADLLSPQRKAAYDSKLRRMHGEDSGIGAPLPASRGVGGEMPILSMPGPPGAGSADPSTAAHEPGSRRRLPRSVPMSAPPPPPEQPAIVFATPPAAQGGSFPWFAAALVGAACALALVSTLLGFYAISQWRPMEPEPVVQNVLVEPAAPLAQPTPPQEPSTGAPPLPGESMAELLQPIEPVEPEQAAPSDLTNRPDFETPPGEENESPAPLEPPGDEPLHTIDPPPQSEPQRLPPPAPADQQQLLERIAQLFPAEEMVDLEARGEVARQLFELGGDTATEPVERFVLLRRAAELASESADMLTLSRSVAQLGEVFEVDPVAIEGKLIARTAQTGVPKGAEPSFTAHVQNFADEALRQNQFEIAAWVLTAAEPAITDPALRGALAERRERVAAQQTKFGAYQAALKTLETLPEDAAANFAVGAWLAFEKGDWSVAVLHFAKAEDALIRAAAAADSIGASAPPQEKLALAGLWFKAAEGREAELREPLLRRAAFWYDRVPENAVAGLSRVELLARREQIQAELAGPPSSTEPGSASAGSEERFALLFEKGVQALRENRYRDADNFFSQCLGIRPNDPAVINNYAATGVRLGHTQRAVRQWQRIVDLGLEADVLLHNLKRMKSCVQRKTVPLDTRSEGDLDSLIAAATGNGAFGSHTSSRGWLYFTSENTVGGLYHEDKACMLCDGAGETDCSVRGCSRGTVKVMSQSVVGRNSVTGQPIVTSTPVPVRCTACSGRGTMRCPGCTSGRDPTVAP